MRKLELGGAALAAFGLSTPAIALDLTTKPGVSWERCYVGGQVGYGWGKANDSLIDSGTTTTVSISALPSPSSGLPSGSTSGWIGGGQAGCNWRPSKDFIVGFEVEGWASDIKGSAVNGIAPPTSFQTRNRWDADITARLGMPMGSVLLYVEGGAVLGHFDYTLQFFKGSLLTGESTRLGALIGGGIEYALSHNLSIKAEYNYIIFGRTDVQLTNGNLLYVHDTKNVFKVGVNYLFDKTK